MNVDNVRSDLLEEQEALDKLLSVLGPEDWRQSTPSPRWSVADQVAHLTYFDNTAVIAITNPDTFRNLVKEIGRAHV